MARRFISSIDAWSDYLAPLIYISKPDKLTLSLGMQQFLSLYSGDWALLMAAALIFVTPVALFFLFFQRYEEPEWHKELYAGRSLELAKKDKIFMETT